MKSFFKKIIPFRYHKKITNKKNKIILLFLRLLFKVLTKINSIKYLFILFSQWNFFSGKFRSIDFVENNLQDIVVVLEKINNKLFFSPPNYSQSYDSFDLFYNSKQIKQYSAIFRNVKVIGGSSILVLNKDDILYDLKYNDVNRKYRYTDSAIYYNDGESCLIGYRRSKQELEEAISLVSNYSSNYYHLMFEVISKFSIIQHLNLDNKIPFLVDEVFFKVHQYKEILQRFNVEKRPIFQISQNYGISVRKLYHISCPNIIPPNFINDREIQPNDCLFEEDSLKFIRESTLQILTKIKFNSKIFISRRNASEIRKFNEDEVFDVLKEYGFQKVHPEMHSFYEQVSMFNNAEFIVGGSGAAFTNLLFCKQHCKVIIISKYKISFSGFSSIATYLKVNLLYVTEDNLSIEDMENIHEPFTVDPTRIKDVIKRWLS